jgi:hypothetical protein
MQAKSAYLLANNPQASKIQSVRRGFSWPRQYLADRISTMKSPPMPLWKASFGPMAVLAPIAACWTKAPP